MKYLAIALSPLSWIIWRFAIRPILKPFVMEIARDIARQEILTSQRLVKQ